MPGVSLLMAEKDKTKVEEVIAILFDEDRFDSESAEEWWERNEHRFVGLDGTIRAAAFDTLARKIEGR
jgi:hypothetical protein